MIRDIKIEMVDHPVPERLPPDAPKRYMALTWKDEHSTCAVNLLWAEETLGKYHVGKDISNVDYLELLTILKEHRKNEKEHLRTGV